MQAFTAELRQAVRVPDQFPGGELSEDVQYVDGSPEVFLRRLRAGLYANEPVGEPEHT